MSLRWFHMVFVLVCIVATDMFGAWAFWRHARDPEASLLIFGTLSFIAGFALIAYVIWFGVKADRARTP